MLFQRWHWRSKLRTSKVFALVGTSGSGKSHRAGFVMEKHGIDILVDDGLIIRDQKILCGKTAKNADNIFDAVGTAIFADEIHRKEAQRVLGEERFKRILLVGTSDKMIRKICHALLLPLPHTRIDITEITTTEERVTALKKREQGQSHVVPVPVMEMNQVFPKMLARSLNLIIRKSVGFFKKDRVIQKSIVRPTYSHQGDIKISEEGLKNIVELCIRERTDQISLERVFIHEDDESVSIDIYISIQRAAPNPSQLLPNLQEHIIRSVQEFTGIIIRKLNIIIDNIT